LSMLKLRLSMGCHQGYSQFCLSNNINHGNKTKKAPYPTLGYGKRR
jgi:hypothetical protein